MNTQPKLLDDKLLRDAWQLEISDGVEHGRLRPADGDALSRRLPV